jgi:hydrogenase maturation protease
LAKNTKDKKPAHPLRILIYGYGNPGRQDDALGLRLVDVLESWAKENRLDTIDTDQNYQLNIEDAHRISDFDLVLFCDASIKDIDNFMLEKVSPDLRTDFSMHQVTPAFVVGLCQQIFGKFPETYQFHIKGYSWEFMEPMTPEAEHNLRLAEEYLCNFLTDKFKT